MFLHNETNASCKTSIGTISTSGLTIIPNSTYERHDYIDEKVKDKKQEDKEQDVFKFKADTLFTMMQSPSVLRMKSHNLAHTFTSYFEENDKAENYISTTRAITTTSGTNIISKNPVKFVSTEDVDPNSHFSLHNRSIHCKLTDRNSNNHKTYASITNKENENDMTVSATSSKTNEMDDIEVNGETASHYQDRRTNNVVLIDNLINNDDPVTSNSIVSSCHYGDDNNKNITNSFNAITNEVHHESSLDSKLLQISHKSVTKKSAKLMSGIRHIIGILSKPPNK